MFWAQRAAANNPAAKANFFLTVIYFTTDLFAAVIFSLRIVASFVHLSHATSADGREDFVRPKSVAGARGM